MSDNTKMLIGVLVALNLALVGVLLFRERSVAPASAQQPIVYGENAIPQPAEPVVQPRQIAPERSDSAAESEGLTRPTSSYMVGQVDSRPAPPERTERLVEPNPTQVARVQVTPPAKQRVRPEPSASRPAQRHQVESPTVGDAPDTSPLATEQPQEMPSTAELESATPLVLPAMDDRAVPSDPPRPRPITVTLAAGRSIPIRLDVRLHSRQLRSGDNFEASLADDLEVDGRSLAAAGSAVTGRVVEVTEAGRVKGVERMRLTLNEVTLAGKTYPVSASIVELAAEDSKERDGKMVGAATAVGAIIGAITKGKKGAATGAATGAAAGAGAVLATRGEALVLESGTVLDFTLTEAVRVTLEGVERDQELEPVPQPEPKPVEVPGIVRR